MTNTGTPWPNKAACTKRCRRTRIVELLGPPAQAAQQRYGSVLTAG